MDPSPISSIIHTITIGTVINNNRSNNGHGVFRSLFYCFRYFRTQTEGCQGDGS